MREAQAKLEKTRKNMHRIAKEQKQMLKAKYNMSEAEVQEMLVQKSRLNYGIKFWSTYRGHERQAVNGILWNGNLR